MPSPASQNTTPAVQVNANNDQQQPHANVLLQDGALLTLLVASLIGIAKMTAPVIVNTFKSKQEANIQAQRESRTAELAIEAATASTMRSLLEQSANASISMNREALEALTGQMSDTLTAVVSKLSDLGIELGKVSATQMLISATQESLSLAMANISSTQGEIADTQRRTLELIESIELSVNDHKSGSERPRARQICTDADQTTSNRLSSA